jgi:hypothetical protein
MQPSTSSQPDDLTSNKTSYSTPPNLEDPLSIDDSSDFEFASASFVTTQRALDAKYFMPDGLLKCFLPEVRQDGWSRTWEATGATNVIIMDDINNAVEPHQQERLIGFEGSNRCLFPAAECAVQMATHVIVLTPPTLQELADTFEMLREFGGKEENLSVWYQGSDNQLIDLCTLKKDPTEYLKLIHKVGEDPPRASGKPFVERVEALRDKLEEDDPAMGSSFVWPYHVRDQHEKIYDTIDQSNRYILPTSSDKFLDKSDACHRITQANPTLAHHFTTPVKISLERQSYDKSLNVFFANAAEKIEYSKDGKTLYIPLSSSQIVAVSIEDYPVAFVGTTAEKHDVAVDLLMQREAFRSSASAIIEVAIEKEERGKGSYIKSDAAGVAGRANISPLTERYHSVYTGTPIERINALTTVLAAKYGNKRDLPDAAIEDCVARVRDGIGVKEYVISGFADSDGFTPWSISRAINNANDIFQGVIGAADPTRIGISPTDAVKLLSLVNKVSNAMGAHGYERGCVAIDVMEDGTRNDFLIQDHNHRRGGRSSLERVIACHPDQVWCDKEYILPVPSGMSAVDFGIETGKRAADNGMYLYGSSMLYYPYKVDGVEVIKAKIIAEVPPGLLANQTNIIGIMEDHLRSLLSL